MIQERQPVQSLRPENATCRPTTSERTPFRREAPRGYGHAKWSEVPVAANRSLEECFERRRWCPLLIHGGTGTGKTCVASLIYRGRKSALWYRADDLLVSLAMGRTSNSVTLDNMTDDGRLVSETIKYREAMNRIRNTTWLFLDDLGVQSMSGEKSGWIQEARLAAMFDLMEGRKGMPTVITSNHGPDRIAELFDDRIVDRLDEGYVLFLDGDSRRAEKRMARRVAVE